MGKIVVSEQISLDGVVDDPSGVEGTSRGGWVNEMSAGDLHSRLLGSLPHLIFEAVAA